MQTSAEMARPDPGPERFAVIAPGTPHATRDAMSYATLTQLQDRFGTDRIVDLTDRGAVSTGVLDEDVVTRALADTDAVIDGFIAGRYRLPLSEVPPIITDIALAIAIYKLHVGTPEDKIVKDYDVALSQLKQVAEGKIELQVEGIAPAASGASGVRVTDRERPMTAKSLRGFI